MKNRGPLSNKRQSLRHILSAAALTILMVMAAAVFCKPIHAAASGDLFHAGGAEGERTQQLQSAGGSQEKPEQLQSAGGSPVEPEQLRSAGGSPVEPEQLQSESGDPEKRKHGMLILEEPREKTRYAEYEMAVGDCFSITFIHSVNKSPVTDVFEIREDGIYGIKTIYYGFGAGVPSDLGEGQTLTYGEDGSMIISGMDIRMKNLIYRVGTVSDHILELEEGEEISLRDLCGRSARVGFRFEAEEEEDSGNSSGNEG